MVTADELAQIHGRMAEAGISNAGAYMRKMALNGYILHVDLAPVRELVSLQRRCSNNLNQIAVHAVVLQIKRAFDWQIILAGKETIVDFLSHCGNTVPHIIRN